MAISLRKANWGLKLFAWRYIPLIGFCSPKIVRMNSKTLEVTMPHSWRTKLTMVHVACTRRMPCSAPSASANH